MSELQKKEDKSGNLLTTMGEGLSSIADTLTGKHLENRVREYTELYADVLLGLHRDLRNLETRSESLPDEKEFRALKAEIRLMKKIILVALLIACASLGGLIWTIVR